MSFLSLSLNLDNKDPLYQQKKTILDSNGIDISKPFQITENAPLPNTLVSALRIHALTNSELSGAMAVQNGRLEAIRPDHSNAFGSENQKNALSMLKNALSNPSQNSAITITHPNNNILQKTNQEINKLL